MKSMLLRLTVVLGLICCGVAAHGASPTTKPWGTGTFGASENSPDTCSVTGDVETLTERCSVLSAEQSGEYGSVVLDSAGGSSATFKGRVAGWGAQYKTGGVFTGGTGGSGGTTTYWDAWFNDANELRIRIEVKEPTHDDDWISCGSSQSGGSLSVSLVGTGSGSYEISIEDEANPDKVMISPATLTLSPGGSTTCALMGLELGQTTLLAQLTTGPTTAAAGREGVEVVPTVTFGSASVKTGFTKDGSKDIFKTISATVVPPAAVNDIDLGVGGENRVSISNVQENAAAGTITAEVRGTSATPNNKPNGDTKIVAKKGGKEIASMDAIVIVPAAIGTPHPQADGPVTPQNMALDATTSPAMLGVPQGSVILGTVYAQWLTIPVVNQFGNVLDSMYEGVPVTERNGVPMNQQIQAGGTYKDPVCRIRQVAAVLKSSPEAQAWPNQPTQPLGQPQGQSVANVDVQVGGHPLNPAIVNRTKIWSTAADGNVSMKVVWP